MTRRGDAPDWKVHEGGRMYAALHRAYANTTSDDEPSSESRGVHDGRKGMWASAALMALVLALFEISNAILPESGIMTAAVAGMVVGNMRTRIARELREFKEQLTIMLVGLAVCGSTAGGWTFSILWFPLFGALAGFLLHNLRGRLYAGDAGALGLGALFAALSLASGLDIWTIATLALPFLIDVLLTLAWRLKHGRNLLDAHLDHAYQFLIKGGWSHLETALLYWGLTATAAVLAYIGAQAGGAAPFIIFWTLTLAGSLIWIRHRHAAKRDNFSD